MDPSQPDSRCCSLGPPATTHSCAQPARLVQDPDVSAPLLTVGRGLTTPYVPVSLFSSPCGKILEPRRTREVSLVTLVSPVLTEHRRLMARCTLLGGGLLIRPEKLCRPWCGNERGGTGRKLCRSNDLVWPCHIGAWVTLRQ